MDFDFTPENVVTAVAGIGAVNVGLAEFANWDLLTELFGSDPALGAAGIALSGVLLVTERFGFTEMFD